MKLAAAEKTNEIFESLARESTLSARVMEQMENLIVSRHLQPGDRLPPERELARQFGVSRTVVREAVTALSARSWLEAAPGGGARVRLPSTQSVTQSMSLLLRGEKEHFDYVPVHEVRRMLETEIATCAALRRTDDDLAKLQKLLAEMAEIGGQGEAAVRNDVEFHAALASATQNPLFPLLLESVADVMLKVRRLGLQIEGSHENALRHHRTIFKAVEKGDAEAARRAMLRHLTDSEKVMKRVTQSEAAQSEVAQSEVVNSTEAKKRPTRKTKSS